MDVCVVLVWRWNFVNQGILSSMVFQNNIWRVYKLTTYVICVSLHTRMNQEICLHLRHYPPAFGEFVAALALELQNVAWAGGFIVWLLWCNLTKSTSSAVDVASFDSESKQNMIVFLWWCSLKDSLSMSLKYNSPLPALDLRPRSLDQLSHGKVCLWTWRILSSSRNTACLWLWGIPGMMFLVWKSFGEMDGGILFLVCWILPNPFPYVTSSTFVKLSITVSAFLSIYLSHNLSIYRSTYLSTCLSFYL